MPDINDQINIRNNYNIKFDEKKTNKQNKKKHDSWSLICGSI